MDLIIFIHGALSSSNSWAYHRLVLDSVIKNRRVELFNYDIERSTSQEVSDALTDSILNLLKTKKYKRVFLIGHSFGGVLAIDAVNKLLLDYKHRNNNVKFKVLTLSSPLGGSGAASFLRILKPFSQFLKNIGSFDSFMTSFKNRKLLCPVHSIVSIANLASDYPIKQSDGVVTVESQIHFKNDPLCTITYVDSNHFEVLLSEKVSKEIANFLT